MLGFKSGVILVPWSKLGFYDRFACNKLLFYSYFFRIIICATAASGNRLPALRVTSCEGVLNCLMLQPIR